jgi:DNA-directed RNA polymerase specialized sigma subunit
MAKRKKVAKAHYVDNAKFLEEMIEYKKMYQISKSNNEELPIISEYLGSVFLKIAQRLSFRPNFINYAFKNDMISDGIENCLHYIHNFNPEKSSNPFAYFTQIIYYAFIRRIQKEKKQLYIKYKSMQNYEISPEYVEYMNYDEDFKTTTDFKNSDFRVVVDEFVDNFEKAKKKKAAVKKKIEPTTLELFMGVAA